MITNRRYDLDWLRILAFAVLIYFHTAVIFIPGGIPMIQNAETSPLLHGFVVFSQEFRLALLFLISGVGVSFAKRRRNVRAFIFERSRRLLIPLAVGILFIVPPMIYTEKVFLGEVHESFWQFYPSFFSNGVYPAGNLSWHHFWFIAYLYLFCLLGTGLFFYLDKKTSMRESINRIARGPGIYAFILPLFVVEVFLRAFFPGFRDLVHDWASFFHWFLIFAAGYVIGNDEKILANALRRRNSSLLVMVISAVLLFTVFDADRLVAPDRTGTSIVAIYIGYCAVRVTLAWSAILTCLGFAGRYLRIQSPLLGYLNEAVYPLFILHLTIITVLGYFVVEWETGIWVKYGFITTATIVIILITYHCLIRPFDVMRLLFGVKPRGITLAPAPGDSRA